MPSPARCTTRPAQERPAYDGLHLPLRAVDALPEAPGRLGRSARRDTFRSQRFLDLPETSWGWRQIKKHAGAGDLFDMTIHRIDFAQDLLGPIEAVCGAVARFAPRDRTATGVPVPPLRG